MLGDVIIVLSQGNFLGGLTAFAILWCMVWTEQFYLSEYSDSGEGVPSKGRWKVITWQLARKEFEGVGMEGGQIKSVFLGRLYINGSIAQITPICEGLDFRLSYMIKKELTEPSSIGSTFSYSHKIGWFPNQFQDE